MTVGRRRTAAARRHLFAASLLLLTSTGVAFAPTPTPEYDYERHATPPPRAFGASNHGRDDFASFQAPIDLNLNLTALKYHAGEAAVGAAAGTAVAWVLRRLQGMAMMITVLGSIGTAAALHLHWVSPEQVRAFLSMALSFGRAKVNEATAYVDFDEDGEVTFDDSRIAYSRIAPHIKQHTALTAGVVGGFLTAYGSLR